jgi:hypothetical protein
MWISLVNKFHITHLPQSLVDDYLFATKIIVDALRVPNYDILNFSIRVSFYLNAWKVKIMKS